MSGPKSDNVIAKTISLPDDIWNLVEAQSDEWRMKRSAAIRRMILEWQKSQPITPKSQKPKTTVIAA